MALGKSGHPLSVATLALFAGIALRHDGNTQRFYTSAAPCEIGSIIGENRNSGFLLLQALDDDLGLSSAQDFRHIMPIHLFPSHRRCARRLDQELGAVVLARGLCLITVALVAHPDCCQSERSPYYGLLAYVNPAKPTGSGTRSCAAGRHHVAGLKPAQQADQVRQGSTQTARRPCSQQVELPMRHPLSTLSSTRSLSRPCCR